MKKFLMPLLMASLMITYALSLNSCKKNDAAIEGTTTEIQQLPDRPIEHHCPICHRILEPSPTSFPIPIPEGAVLESTDYSCYHEYALNEICTYSECDLFPRHHFHYFYVGHTHNSTGSLHEHLGGGSK